MVTQIREVDVLNLVSDLAGKQPLDGTLTALAALTIAADSLTVGTGADAFNQTTFAANTFPAKSSAGALVAKTLTDFALTLLDDADAATARTTLGAGTSNVTLPITEANVTNLTNDLAAKEATANKNVANGYAGLNASSRTTKGVDTTDDVIIDLAAMGLVLKDTQATPHYWRLRVNNLGILFTTDLGTTKP